MPLLSLSDEQLNLVQRTAAMLLVYDRDHFLRSIANRIGDVARPSDHEVQDALDLVLNCRGVAAGLEALAIPHPPPQAQHGLTEDSQVEPQQETANEQAQIFR